MKNTMAIEALPIYSLIVEQLETWQNQFPFLRAIRETASLPQSNYSLLLEFDSLIC